MKGQMISYLVCSLWVGCVEGLTGHDVTATL